MYKKYIQCRTCKGKNPKTSPPGFIRDIETKNGINYPIVRECLCHKVWAAEENAYSEWIKSGFRSEYFTINNNENGEGDYVGTKSIGNIIRLYQYIDKFDNPQVSSSVLYFFGLNGTQKTVTANWIANRLIRRGKSVYAPSMKELLDKLWKEEREDICKEHIDLYSNCDLLIIEESFDKEKAHIWDSGKQIGYLDNFIRNRLNNNKGIIFISNKGINEIKKNGFSDSLVDLIERETKKRDSFFTFYDNYFDSVGSVPEKLF